MEKARSVIPPFFRVVFVVPMTVEEPEAQIVLC